MPFAAQKDDLDIHKRATKFGLNLVRERDIPPDTTPQQACGSQRAPACRNGPCRKMIARLHPQKEPQLDIQTAFRLKTRNQSFEPLHFIRNSPKLQRE